MIAGTRVFTYAEYIALGIAAPWEGPFALENRTARDAGGTGKYYLSRGMEPLGGCVHITAGITDLDGQDSSAEATTNYGQTTSNDASWTSIVDFDSIINSLHPDRVAWVQGVSGYNFNRPIVGVEIGLRETDWTILPDWWIEGTLRNLAAVYAPYVVRYDWPLRLVQNRDEVQAYIDREEPFGFTEHWNLSPETRSDAGLVGRSTTFPWERFFNALADRVEQLTGNRPTYSLPEGIMATRQPTRADMRRVEAEFRRRGLDIYCGPSDYDAGRCAPGKHPHDSNSRHFKGLAVDFGYGAAPINDLEALLVELIMNVYLKRWFPELRLRKLWNRPNDHKDHGHLDDMGGQPYWGDSVTPRPGVRARDGVDLFVPLKVIPEHVPPINGRLTLRQVADAQVHLRKYGYTGAIDGYNGDGCKAATIKAQKALGLDPDGYPGPNTLKALISGGTTTPKPVYVPDYSSFSLSEIMDAQRLNKQAGWYVGKDTDIDGSPGPNFQASMDKGQRVLAEKGLYKGEHDLLPGPKYMTALRTYLNPPLLPEPEPDPEPEPPAPQPEPEPVGDIEAVLVKVLPRIRIIIEE